jgi:muconolactone D-isomerase
MEFLVRIDVDLPPDLSEPRRRELLEAEAARGRELVASGALRRIWRVPGRRANVSLYEAPDATELHALLTSLPLWPWMDVDVQALATHPLEAP